MLLLSVMMNTRSRLTTFAVIAFLVFGTTESKISRSLPELNLSDWSKLDLEFGSSVSHIHHGVSRGDISTSEGIFKYTKSLKQFLESKPEFIYEETAYYRHNPPKTLEEARKQKNRLRKLKNRPGATKEDKDDFLKALRYYNFLLKQKKEKGRLQQS